MDEVPIGQTCEEVQNPAMMARVRTEQKGTHDDPSEYVPSNDRRAHSMTPIGMRIMMVHYRPLQMVGRLL